MKQLLTAFLSLFRHTSMLLIIGLFGAGFLLSSCGQEKPSSSTTSVLTPSVPSQYPEPVQIPDKRTDLKNTYPGGQKPLKPQKMNKNIPIILVHGLAGWSRNEMAGYRYWGGLHDVQDDLNARGSQVFTAALGAASSNWHRAAELFVQIKGGCVDYGAAHAKQFGHDRFDKTKCYKGFYPQWDEKHPINLIGHSMGGQTIRMLVKFLEDGSPENASGHNVFTGGRIGWVKALMTISTPNSGTPAPSKYTKPLVKEILFGMAALAGAAGPDQALPYDFHLGQWGLVRRKNEALDDYIQRVLDSKIWTTNDNAAYDVSVDGAAELNQFIGRSKHVIYTSWYNSASYRGLISGWHYPKLSMFTPFKILAYPYPPPAKPGLGNVTGSTSKGILYDHTWWENDGIIPLKSMTAPMNQSSVTYHGQALKPGEWYNLGKLEGWDHIDLVGWFSEKMDVRPFYRNQADFLNNIP